MSEFAIDIQDITKVFDGKTVVDNVTLSVRIGSIFGFLGSNGSGKTTMIRMICGLLIPTHGTGHCLGYDIKTQGAEIKKRIGYMPQKFSFYTGLTVQQNLQFVADIYQIKDPERAIEKTITDFELQPYKNQRVGFLSGGWKQSLALACCLLHTPKLLFLDEPTAGVDPVARKKFWDTLHKISITHGTTILVTTHYMDEIEKCTDLAYINLGKLLYTGTMKDLIPFSDVKAYSVDDDRQSLNKLSENIARTNPKLLVSMVNNELRISSRHQEQLITMTQEQQGYQFKEVTPSFEEVFIGLMQ